MSTFPGIALYDGGDVDLVDLARPVGPLEDGRYDGGVWVPRLGPQRIDGTEVGGPGWGIDASGNPYYDPILVDAGEEASLWIDPTYDNGVTYFSTSPSVWLQRNE